MLHIRNNENVLLMNPVFKNYLIKLTGSSSILEEEIIQSLWSGYGKISRCHLESSKHKTVVVKFISLNQSIEHPRGWDTDCSHQRKVKSYAVETCWYEKWNERCNAKCKTPKFLGSFSEGKDQWIVLEDLDVDFPLRKQEVEFTQVKACLIWLANFHAAFLGQKPYGLWDVGSYWHLETRPEEFKKIEHQELKDKAHLIDETLNKCSYQTIIHGDAKLANFCFSENGEQVSAVDFQYAGGGCGIKDVAYFLGSCLSSDESEIYENELLDFYFSELRKGLDSSELVVDFQELQHQWRDLYAVACADFMRFMLGWMPTHQKINGYNLRLLNSVLSKL